MVDVSIYALSPDVRSAIKAVVKYIEINSDKLDQNQLECGATIKHLLKRLESEWNQLIKMNNELIDAHAPKMSFNNEDDNKLAVTLKFGKIFQTMTFKGGPDGPPRISQPVVFSGGYIAGKESPNKITITEEPESKMESMLEGYYSNAFTITQLIKTLIGKKKYHCEEITMVRNELIVHPKKGSLYSFGFSQNGPVVSPLYREAPRKHDKGLVPNTNALVESIIRVMNIST